MFSTDTSEIALPPGSSLSVLISSSDEQERLTTARAIALAAGLRYVYTGNVRDEPGQSTYCPDCGTRVIGRDWYEITAWHLTPDGRCGACGAAVVGVFEARPGAWGQRRAPIRIGGKPDRILAP